MDSHNRSPSGPFPRQGIPSHFFPPVPQSITGGAMSLSPRPHVCGDSLAARSSSPMAQCADASMPQGNRDSIGCEGHVDLELMENREVGLMRRRVIPPTDCNGQPLQAPSPNVSQQPQFPFPDAARGVVKEKLSGAMDSGGSFTNVITKGFGLSGQFENPPPLQKVVTPGEVQAIRKGHQKRTKNFTVEEDELLMKAWLNVSLDPVKGVDQSHTTYWNRIHAYFYAHKDFSSDRTQGSLMNRWSGIKHDVNLFADCLSKIEGRNQSGVTIDDKQADALKMFINEDGQHRQFPYMHCWKLLKDQPKWTDKRKQMKTQKPISKKQKVLANSSFASAPPLLPAATVDENHHSNSALQRPLGQKKEKRKLQQHSSIEAMDYLLAKKKEADAEKELKKEERCKKAFALQEERIRLEKEKLELQRDQFEFNKNLEEERIMNVDTSHMCTDQHRYYEWLKNSILARRLNN